MKIRWFIWLVAFLAPVPEAVAQQDGSVLPPGAMILPEPALPDYEKDIDHAGMIATWDKNSLNRGREIYQMVCHSCHGDVNLPGSIPNAMRFAGGEFQHGADPYTLYQTITRGWRFMVPQVQLVPREKYDVIHFIRENFLRPHNPGQLTEITDEYLAGLPAGTGRGPAPVKREPWKDMDYGPFLIGTFELVDEVDRGVAPPGKAEADYVAPDANIAQKAIAVRLDDGEGGVAGGNAWVIFEHDTLRIAGAWTGEGFIDWEGINFNGRHVVRPRTIGEMQFETADGPGWATPGNGIFKDPRIKGLDGRRFGPMPERRAHYRGLYKHGNRVVISYTVGKASILESHRLVRVDDIPVFVRTLNIGESKRDLEMRVASSARNVAVSPQEVALAMTDGFVVLRIPAAATPISLNVYLANHFPKEWKEIVASDEVKDLAPLTSGGPAQWPDAIETVVIRGEQGGPFQWDSFSLPLGAVNPWKSRMRTSGFDFLPDGKSAIVCCWDGDVWKVDGITEESATVRWRRIASGLFQPLGVKIRDGEIFVSCRDQIVRLVDLNGDGETDFYENFNSDHQVTEHFHEFAMGLQADAEGNFYYAKSARHGRPPLVPQHGTLIKVSADGRASEILANGFRAANGVCLNPDGSFIVTDQEGHWNPMNRINRVTPGEFYGNMWSYGAPEDSSDAAMEPPLCWVDKAFDRSPAELLWVTSESWKPLQGKLLNLSYGNGRLGIVLQERVGDQWQGGLCRLPIPAFPTGIMRGRFRPGDGHLFLCGLSAWSTERVDQPGGFYRVRRTEKPLHLPVGLRAASSGVEITFTEPLDAVSVADLENFDVRTWALVRSENYGSAHCDTRELEVEAATLSDDGRTLGLMIPEIAPCWQMEIVYKVAGANGEPIEGVIQNTIHVLR